MPWPNHRAPTERPWPNHQAIMATGPVMPNIMVSKHSDWFKKIVMFKRHNLPIQSWWRYFCPKIPSACAEKKMEIYVLFCKECQEISVFCFSKNKNQIHGKNRILMAWEKWGCSLWVLCEKNGERLEMENVFLKQAFEGFAHEPHRAGIAFQSANRGCLFRKRIQCLMQNFLTRAYMSATSHSWIHNVD